MTKLTAFITTLVVGSSSLAMAEHLPRETRSEFRGYSDRDATRDHREYRARYSDRAIADRDRYDDDAGPRRYRPTWVSLGDIVDLAEGGRGRIEVNVRGTFTQLRLQTASGRSYIDRVIVMFRDGSRQIANVGRTLDERDRMFELQLDGNNRSIDRVIVLGDASRRGALQIFGI